MKSDKTSPQVSTFSTITPIYTEGGSVTFQRKTQWPIYRPVRPDRGLTLPNLNSVSRRSPRCWLWSQPSGWRSLYLPVRRTVQGTFRLERDLTPFHTDFDFLFRRSSIYQSDLSRPDWDLRVYSYRGSPSDSPVLTRTSYRPSSTSIQRSSEVLNGTLVPPDRTRTLLLVFTKSSPGVPVLTRV